MFPRPVCLWSTVCLEHPWRPDLDCELLWGCWGLNPGSVHLTSLLTLAPVGFLFLFSVSFSRVSLCGAVKGGTFCRLDWPEIQKICHTILVLSSKMKGLQHHAWPPCLLMYAYSISELKRVFLEVVQISCLLVQWAQGNWSLYVKVHGFLSISDECWDYNPVLFQGCHCK